MVVLDPRHGKIDPSADGGLMSEADLMLIFADALHDVLLHTGGTLRWF